MEDDFLDMKRILPLKNRIYYSMHSRQIPEHSKVLLEDYSMSNEEYQYHSHKLEGHSLLMIQLQHSKHSVKQEKKNRLGIEYEQLWRQLKISVE